jgi:hypothetical protein
MTGKEYLNDRVKVNTSDLFKRMLMILEDIKHEHDRQFAKLLEAAPESFKPVVNQANYLDDEKAAYLRKRILDVGNELLRKLASELEQVRVEFHHTFKQ